MTGTSLSTNPQEQGVIRDLLEALKDLLGDLPSVQGGVCRHCGREYDDILSGDCPSDDCPSFNACAALVKFGVACSDSRRKPYSVLLLYPDYADDTGYQTYYAFVEALHAVDAAAVAQRQAVAALPVDVDDPTDFHPLLVTQGHHASLPLFDK